MRSRFSRIALAVMLMLAGLSFGSGSTAAAQDQQLQAIPDAYVGNWSRHGIGLTITRADAFPQAGNAIAQWRTYTWCQDTLTGQQNPPPCDLLLGDQIADGGVASIVLMHPQGQDDATLSGVVAATSDPRGFGQQGDDVEFSMLPGNMLQVTFNGQTLMFCGDNTDLAQYGPSPCGA